MTRATDPDKLAIELLGRALADLEPEEQTVRQRVAAGTYVGLDASEVAQSNVRYGDRLADRVAAIGGSWGFIIAFGVVLFGWIYSTAGCYRSSASSRSTHYPYIFLNLMLSMLAAIQAPVIMMSQNRQSAKDRIAARHDYEVNLRTQLEILRLSRRIDRFAHMMLRVAHKADDDKQLGVDIQAMIRELGD